MFTNPAPTRREFIGEVLRASSAVLAAPAAISVATVSPAMLPRRPAITHGVASGDVEFDSAVVWSRADRRSRMIVDWATTESFARARTVRGPWTGDDNDFTAKLLLKNLPPGQRIFYRVRFEDDSFAGSEPATGSFVTASRDERDVTFAWSADTCGQGYGISEQFGGLKTYDSIRQLQPDFFVHSGDNIYADGVIEAQKRTADGTIFRNLTTPEKSKVAETLDEFRGNYRYNLLDAHVRRFNSEVAMFSQWDDHEVLNNWYPGQVLDDRRYTVKDVDLLAARARRAFLDYLPIRGGAGAKIYRAIRRGPLCDLFFLDLRSYRGPNTHNRQQNRSAETDFMGTRQLAWLKEALRRSRAVWKVICSDMPIGMIVGDGRDSAGRNRYENCANGNGPALGRELEIAELLEFMQHERIGNTFWLTGDVHYAASIYYDATKAQFTRFNSFWEFISGPLHAASLAPGSLDNTFGPQLRWSSRPRGSRESGPHTAEQFFSTVQISGKTKVATVTHLNREGKKLWSMDLEPGLA